MKLQKIQIGEKEVMPFGIPSGCAVTSEKCLESVLGHADNAIGFADSKSYGKEPRVVPERDEVEHPIEGKEYAYRESILTQYIPGGFLNAVGLSNPGADEGARRLSRIHVPKNKAVIGSVYGRDLEEFKYVASRIAPHVDAIEANESCPHVKGHGMVLCDDLDFIRALPSAVKSVISGKPFYVKLPPLPNIAKIAQVSIEGGADGIVLINTERAYSSILSNGNCGISGIGIRPLGVRCTRDVRQAVGEKVLIIAGGGIETGEHALEYFNAGANAVTIGSGFAGMTEAEILTHSDNVIYDIENGTDKSRYSVKRIDMSYRKFRIEEIVNPDCDFKVIRTNQELEAKPGQFVFAYIPGVGEKPFSIMDDNPLTLGVLERGYFTRRFNFLKKGDEFYVRGPHGQGVEVPDNSNVVLVGGGCGIAGLYLLAKRLSEKANVISLLGAKDREHLPYIERFSRFGDVRVVTEDEGYGRKGTVVDLLREDIPSGSCFFNCGPRAMIEAVLPLERNYSSDNKIYSSVDYMTRCGVGICGSCADNHGRRTCVEGPFMSLS